MMAAAYSGGFRFGRHGVKHRTKLVQHDGAAGVRADVAEAKAGIDSRPAPAGWGIEDELSLGHGVTPAFRWS